MSETYFCEVTERREGYGNLALRCYLRDGHDGPHRDSVLGALWWPRTANEVPAASAAGHEEDTHG